jgi:SAM-dependent methyltransferase
MDSKAGSKMYGAYFDSAFKHSNILSKREYENIAKEFNFYYGAFLPANKDAPILDVGCGGGHFLYFLKKKGYTNYLGIDISAQQIDFCKKNITEKVKLADAFQFLKNNKKEYSVIIAHDVLEHIVKSKTYTFLRLILGSLDENGLLVLRVPNMSNPFSLDSRYKDFTHETGFTEKSLYQLLWDEGFREILITSSTIRIASLKNRVRYLLVAGYQKLIRFLYYIQDFSVPEHLGKNLIVICRKQ